MPDDKSQRKPERVKVDVTEEEIERLLTHMAATERFRGGSDKLSTLRHLMQESRRGTILSVAAAMRRQPAAVSDGGNKTRVQVAREALNEYNSAEGADQPIQFKIPGGKSGGKQEPPGFWALPDERPAPVQQSSEDTLSAVRAAGPLHQYHATFIREKRLWYYSPWNSPEGETGDVLRTTVHFRLPDADIDTKYRLKAHLSGETLVVTEDVSPGKPFTHLGVYPDFAQSFRFGKTAAQIQESRIVCHGLTFHIDWDGAKRFSPLLISSKPIGDTAGFSDLREGPVPEPLAKLLDRHWAEMVRSTPLNSTWARMVDPDSPLQSDPAAALTARFSFLRDPSFGNEIIEYLAAASPDGVYCQDLYTAFSFNNTRAGQFDGLDAQLLNECFHLTIHETVNKICVGNTLRFSAFLDGRELAKHLSEPRHDFVWHIDLPDDASFQGKASDLFKISYVRVGTAHIDVTGGIKVECDDATRFSFTVDISGYSAASGNPIKLGYEFRTLKAKAFRHVSYGTRFLTRGMRAEVIFDTDPPVKSVYISPHFSGLDKLEPERFTFGNRGADARGWLLPRSGITFVYRYDETQTSRKNALPAASQRSHTPLNTFSGEWHYYHNTIDAAGEFWSYTVLKFPPCGEADQKLIARAVCLPETPWKNASAGQEWTSDMIKDYRNQNLYQFEATLVERYLVLTTTKVDSQTDMSVKVFRDPRPHLDLPQTAMMLITDTWAGTPAVTAAIMRKGAKLHCADVNAQTVLRETDDGEPIRDAATMKALAREWTKRYVPEPVVLIPGRTKPETAEPNGATLYQEWDEKTMLAMLKRSARNATIRIFVSFFVRAVELFEVLTQLLTDEGSARTVELMMLDPDAPILKLRYPADDVSFRDDGITASNAEAQIREQLGRLERLLHHKLNNRAKSGRKTGALRAYGYRCSPTLISYQCDGEAMMGMLLIHTSGNNGPMIHIRQGQPLWEIAKGNWNTALMLSDTRLLVGDPIDRDASFWR